MYSFFYLFYLHLQTIQKSDYYPYLTVFTKRAPGGGYNILQAASRLLLLLFALPVNNVPKHPPLTFALFRLFFVPVSRRERETKNKTKNALDIVRCSLLFFACF